MPLFHKAEPAASERNSVQQAPAQAPVQEQRHSGLFNRHRSVSPATTNSVQSNGVNGTNGVNGHNGSIRSGRQGSLLHRNATEDPSISAARDRVFSAEAAEREADKALAEARGAVRIAREHVKRLEEEAAEE